MIPKIIHFCWFGRGKYPELVNMCIESWKRVLPDYEIKLWDEESFDVNICNFTKMAYEKKRWAFVSDFARLFALYQYGGVYMDTDMEVLKDFSIMLKEDKYVSSFLEGGFLSAGFIACPAKNAFIERLLNYYTDRMWTFNDFEIMNPIIFSKIAKRDFDISIGKEYCFNDQFAIYPAEYFAPYKKSIFGEGMKRFQHRKYRITDNTFVVHHEMGSWGKSSTISKIIRGMLRLIVPYRWYNYLKRKRAIRLISEI